MTETQFTSEAVSRGHPDKVADQISDALLDACLEQDPYSRVGCEALIVDHLVVIAGELATDAHIDPQEVVQRILHQSGYHDPEFGYHQEEWRLELALRSPSSELLKKREKEIYAASDQGIMIGYACNETPELIPFSHQFALQIMQRLDAKRLEGELNYLGTDAKCLVTAAYHDSQPSRIASVVVSAQHKRETPLSKLRQEIKRQVASIAPPGFIDDATLFLINPLGTFIKGGSLADTGVTGRKIMADSYGTIARQGGGCFSGKDPSKLDRSGAYIARFIAKNIVSAKLADACEVRLAYAIDKAQPLSFQINTFGTSCWSPQNLEKRVKETLDLTPEGIVKYLDLRKPRYLKTAWGGHFGRSLPEFTWEKVVPIYE
jgi:S-adenosylmethionine synthetase